MAQTETPFTLSHSTIKITLKLLFQDKNIMWLFDYKIKFTSMCTKSCYLLPWPTYFRNQRYFDDLFSLCRKNVPSRCHHEAFLGTVSDIRPPPNISMVTLPNNHGPAHNQRVMKYIPFKNPSHQTRLASSPPPWIKFGTERRNEV